MSHLAAALLAFQKGQAAKSAAAVGGAASAPKRKAGGQEEAVGHTAALAPKPKRPRAARQEERLREAESARRAAERVAKEATDDKVPLPARLKRVTDAVERAQGRTMTYDAILEASKDDLLNDGLLRNAIASAGFITLDDSKRVATFASKGTVRSGADVLSVARARAPAALPLDELAKAYEGVEDDVEAFVRAGRMYRVNALYGDTLLFAADASACEALGPDCLPASDAVAAAVASWKNADVPWEPRALVSALRARGIAPFSDPATRQRIAPPPDERKKAKKARKKVSAHNTHLDV